MILKLALPHNGHLWYLKVIYVVNTFVVLLEHK